MLHINCHCSYCIHRCVLQKGKKLIKKEMFISHDNVNAYTTLCQSNTLQRNICNIHINLSFFFCSEMSLHSVQFP